MPRSAAATAQFQAMRRSQMEQQEQQRRHRLDDLADMANWGVPFDEAAKRIGLTVDSLHRFLMNHNKDLARDLTRNSARRGLTIHGRIADPWSNGGTNRKAAL